VEQRSFASRQLIAAIVIRLIADKLWQAVLQGPAAGLAICHHEGEDCFYLFGCDSSWNTVTDTWHQSLDDALAQAEFEYEGVSKTWQKHGPA